MRTRSGVLLLLLALLPGLGLAQGASLRVCLAALVGGGDCCTPAEDAASCCSRDPAAPGERARASSESCSLCCVELSDEGAVARTAPRAELDLAHALPVTPLLLRAFPAPVVSGAPPPAPLPRPPDLARNLPLRI